MEYPEHDCTAGTKVHNSIGGEILEGFDTATSISSPLYQRQSSIKSAFIRADHVS